MQVNTDISKAATTTTTAALTTSIGLTSPRSSKDKINHFTKNGVGAVGSNGVSLESERTSGNSSSQFYCGHDKNEVSRLLMQALSDLGHSDIASALEKKTGLAIELPVVSQFRSAIINGDWDLSESLLKQIKLRPNIDRKYLRFLIRRQQFLEFLEQQNIKDALMILRTKISTLTADKRSEDDDDMEEDEAVTLSPEEKQSRLLQVAQLSNLVMYSKEDLIKSLSLDVGKSHSRYYLLNALQEFVASDMMIPRHRLATLLDQAEEFQLSRWNYRIKNDYPRSLIIDYALTNNTKIVPQTVHKLIEHTDEVWCVSFSHDGKYLATGSRDSSVIVWRVSDWSIQARLEGHERGVMWAEWSPDDKKILTCGQDHFTLLFDPMTGTKLQTMSGHLDIVSSCSWLPSSQHFFTASPDKTTKLWSITGDLIKSWEQDRILAMAVTPNGAISVSITYDHNINFCNLMTDFRVTRLNMGPMNSLKISSDSRYALVHLDTDELHLWDLRSLTVVRKYFQSPETIVKNYMNEPEKFVLWPCFGGPDENIVACGSVDGNISLWNRETTELLDTIRGHQGAVSCIQFNPKQTDMMASCSDDNVVRIWKF